MGKAPTGQTWKDMIYDLCNKDGLVAGDEIAYFLSKTIQNINDERRILNRNSLRTEEFFEPVLLTVPGVPTIFLRRDKPNPGNDAIARFAYQVLQRSEVVGRKNRARFIQGSKGYREAWIQAVAGKSENGADVKVSMPPQLWKNLEYRRHIIRGCQLEEGISI